MSLWFRDECRIVLRPHQLVLAQLRRQLTRHGVRSQVLASRIVPCRTPRDPESWSGALHALEAVMPDIAEHGSSATVILSNHFMRYAMVPWSDALNEEAEELSYAQHMFHEMYGLNAGEWELRISPGKSGEPQLASAVDAGLLAALRGTFGEAKVGLGSVKPHLMLACNACHSLLRRQSAWLALVEQGSLCLALLHNGQLSWVRTMRVGPLWHKELPFLLNREAMVADAGIATDEVLLWSPDSLHTPDIAGGRWKIRQLQPPRMPDNGQWPDRRFAMYMSD
ncbi:MAG TPA: hypothetical protein VK149_03240 [Sideroxyarcus sp.]|nr:hypothetical protein [Sideroxyarcus sp.]